MMLSPILCPADELLIIPQHPGSHAHLQVVSPHSLWVPVGSALTTGAREGREYISTYSLSPQRAPSLMEEAALLSTWSGGACSLSMQLGACHRLLEPAGLVAGKDRQGTLSAGSQTTRMVSWENLPARWAAGAEGHPGRGLGISKGLAVGNQAGESSELLPEPSTEGAEAWDPLHSGSSQQP